MDLGEALSAEAKLRPTEGGGKHPPEAKSFGKSSAEELKRREMPPPPVTSCETSRFFFPPIYHGLLEGGMDRRGCMPRDSRGQRVSCLQAMEAPQKAPANDPAYPVSSA